MRWFVEVTSGEKTELQKYVVEAESWQRALQAARAQRGEQGPMSGFSIELLDEGYRAVDPVARNKFVVKRAPDDAALSIPPPGAAASPGASPSKAPAAPKGAPKAPAPLPSKTSVPPAAASSSAKSIPPAGATKPAVPATSKSMPPRPAEKKDDKKDEKPSSTKKSRSERKSEKMKAATAKKEAERLKSQSPPPPSIEPEEEEAPKTESQPEPATLVSPPAPEPVRKKEDTIPPAPLLPVGAFVPGLPSVKLMSSREQDPTDASPLTYREYSFSIKEGTSEEVAEKVLRAQLKIVAAHLEKLKQGKLVNLAVFDGDPAAKPAGPPLCTLAWKDWKGEPVIAFPRRGGAGAKPVVKPPTASPASVVMPPASMPPNPPPQMSAMPVAPVVNMPPGYSQPPPSFSQTQNMTPAGSTVPRPPGAIAAMLGAAKVGSERKLPVAAPSEPSTTPSAPNPLNQTVKDAVSPFADPPASAQNPFSAPPPSAANPFAPTPSAPPPAPGAPVGPGTSPMIPVAQPVSPPPAAVATAPSAVNPFAAPAVPQAANPFGNAPNPFAPAAPSVPPPPVASFPPPPPQAAQGSMPPPAYQANPAPVPMTQSSPPPARRSSHPPEGVVRTPSGRFVRGRVTGDELITQLFESMHDLHFLRDALDGGQFCLALAMEMIPVRVALIHFFDVEKREWIVACTRGKDAGKLLTTRTPETDDLLRAAARHRRAIVTPNGAHAQAQRYQTLGGARSMIIAPIMQAGRALGAIEMVNPADGMPFNEDEGNAMTYIAEQYAEYLGSRGIVVQVERIRAAASA